MPIYAYRCEACGFSKDVLQKVSDPQLTVCLSCGEPTFKKQVTAAGFQLKGTGWYATDFRNGSGTAAPAVAANAGEGGDAKAGTEKSAGEKATGEKSGGERAAGDTSASSAAGAGTGNSGGASADKAAPAAAGTSKPSTPASGSTN